MRRFLLGGAFCALAFSTVASAAKEPVYAVTKARIVTVSGATIENGTLVMRGGLIVDVGPNAAVPKDARVIDGTGLTITPGLFDGFGNVGIPSPRPGGGGGAGGGPGGGAAATPAANPIDPGGRIYERVRAPEALRARDQGVTTIVPVPREGFVAGSAAILNLSGDRPEAMVVKNDVALAAHMTTAGGQRYPGSLMGTMAFFRQALLDAAHYRDAHADYEKAPAGKPRPKFDAALEAWGGVLGGAKPLLVQTLLVGDARRAYALADEFRLKLILAGNLRVFEDAAFLKERKPALLVSVNFDPPRAGGFGGFGGGPDDDRERKDIADAEGNPAALHREGIPFALVSGFASDFVAGVRKAIEKGLPKDVALRAITLTPAEIYGVADRLGSLDKGKIANAVVWSGDPLTKDAKVKMVFVEGQLHQPEERPAGPGGPPGGRPGETEGDLR